MVPFLTQVTQNPAGSTGLPAAAFTTSAILAYFAAQGNTHARLCYTVRSQQQFAFCEWRARITHWLADSCILMMIIIPTDVKE
jgi:membrane protein DedA with SNARE-associated domain